MKKFESTYSLKQSLIIMVSILCSITLFSQRYDYKYTEIEAVGHIATYTLKYMKDTTNPNFIRNVDMLLFIGQSTSMFIEKEMYIVDTIKRKMTSRKEIQEFYMDKYRPFPKIRYRIYKNYPNKKLTFIEHVIGGTFKFEEDLDLFNWQLSNDTAMFNGYKTRKASCDFGGRSWIAWFCPEIPYNDGPYKFNGLPGLIVKIGDTREHYVFELISIERPEKEIMIDMKQKDYLISTKQGFFKAKDAFRDDIINRAKAAGLSSKDQQTAARNMDELNNPIELIRK